MDHMSHADQRNSISKRDRDERVESQPSGKDSFREQPSLVSLTHADQEIPLTAIELQAKKDETRSIVIQPLDKIGQVTNPDMGAPILVTDRDEDNKSLNEASKSRVSGERNVEIPAYLLTPSLVKRSLEGLPGGNKPEHDFKISKLADNSNEKGVSKYLTISLQRSIAGGIAAGLAKTMTAPLERVRIIRQASDRGTSTASQLLRQIYLSDGIKALWRGNAVNLSRVIPSYAVRFTVFGNLSQYSDQNKFLLNPFIAGSLSGTASALASYPLEVLRTRISVSGSLRDALRKGGLFAGSSLTVLEATPYAGLTLGTYSYLKTNYPAVNIWDQIAHGFFAGSVGTLVCFPLDTLRRNKIMRPDQSIATIAADLYREGKIIRYYRGMSIALVKAAPTVALTMIFNDLFLHTLGVY